MRKFYEIVIAINTLSETLNVNPQAMYESMVHYNFEATSREFLEKVFEGQDQDEDQDEDQDIIETYHKPIVKTNTKRYNLKDKAKAGSKPRTDRLYDKAVWLGQETVKSRKIKEAMDMKSMETYETIDAIELSWSIYDIFNSIQNPLLKGEAKCYSIVLDALQDSLEFDAFTLDFISQEVSGLFEDKRNEQAKLKKYIESLEQSIELNSSFARYYTNKVSYGQGQLVKARLQLEEF